MTPRGIRNNNPGNIRYNRYTKWLGQTGLDDAGFLIFASPVLGLRAIYRILTIYERVHHLTTLRAIIDRWAPPAENDTTAYLHYCSGYCRLDPDAVLDLDTNGLTLLRAIVHYENGEQPYTTAQLQYAVLLSQTK